MQNTVLITGASGGIGSAAAVYFAERGYAVALHGHSRIDAARALARELNRRGLPAIAVSGDLTREQDVKALRDAVLDAFGHVDVLINNAGIALPQMLLTDCVAEDWDRLFAADVRSMFLCCKAFLPGMISRKQGSIVNVSSMWGVTGGSCEVPYSAAKAAVIGFTKALAKETAPSGIRVNCIAPGFIDTAMNGHLTPEDREAFRLDTPLERIGTPEDAARVLFFLAGEDSSFMTGQTLCCDGGICI